MIHQIKYINSLVYLTTFICLKVLHCSVSRFGLGFITNMFETSSELTVTCHMSIPNIP